MKISVRIGRKWKIGRFGLTIVFFVLFLFCLLGQSISGWYWYNQTQHAMGGATVGYLSFLQSATFLDGMFSNQQAAILQLAMIVILTTFLYQVGAVISRSPRKKREKVDYISVHRRIRFRIYENSLSIALFAVFLTLFWLHLEFACKEYNSQLKLEGLAPISVSQYFLSPNFWFLTFQTGEAEFMAMVILLIFTIFLRQKHSAESKPVTASNAATGVKEK